MIFFAVPHSCLWKNGWMKVFPSVLSALIVGLVVFFVQEQRIQKLEDQISSNETTPLPPGKPTRTSSLSSSPSTSKKIVSAKANTSREVSDPRGDDEEKENPVQSMSEIFETDAGRAMIKQGIEASIPMMYGDFIEGLDLTPEEQKYFKELLTERMMTQQQLGMKWMQANEAEKEEIALEIEKSRKENSKQIDEFLQNSEDSTAFKTYEQQLPERQQMAGIRNALSEEPLAPETESQLVETMYQARLHSGEGNGGEDENWQSLAETGNFDAIEGRWDKTDAEIARTVPDVLTPAQTEAFLAHWKQVRALQKTQYQMGMQALGIQEKE